MEHILGHVVKGNYKISIRSFGNTKNMFLLLYNICFSTDMQYVTKFDRLLSLSYTEN